MDGLRDFLQTIIGLFVPRPKKKKRVKIKPGSMKIGADEFLIDGKPFRFKGKRRKVDYGKNNY